MSELPTLQQIAYTKIVQSGDMIEIYDYEKAPNITRRSRRKKQTRYRTRRQHRNVQRAKDNFRRLVRVNLMRGCPAFATLTMVSTVSVKTAYKYFSKWTTSMRRAYGHDIAWVGVVEFQKRGAVHFHVLIWGLHDATIERERDTRDIQALWLRGWLDIFKTDGSPKISSYMAKYMYKSMQDARLFGEKSYTASRNCMRPVSLNTGTQLAVFEEMFPEIRGVDINVDNVEADRIYSTEWLGRCHYRKLKANVKEYGTTSTQAVS